MLVRNPLEGHCHKRGAGREGSSNRTTRYEFSPREAQHNWLIMNVPLEWNGVLEYWNHCLAIAVIVS